MSLRGNYWENRSLSDDLGHADYGHSPYVVRAREDAPRPDIVYNPRPSANKSAPMLSALALAQAQHHQPMQSGPAPVLNTDVSTVPLSSLIGTVIARMAGALCLIVWQLIAAALGRAVASVAERMGRKRMLLWAVQLVFLAIYWKSMYAWACTEEIPPPQIEAPKNMTRMGHMVAWANTTMVSWTAQVVNAEQTHRAGYNVPFIQALLMVTGLIWGSVGPSLVPPQLITLITGIIGTGCAGAGVWAAGVNTMTQVQLAGYFVACVTIGTVLRCIVQIECGCFCERKESARQRKKAAAASFSWSKFVGFCSTQIPLRLSPCS
jgi:hypothetical protein